MANTYHWKFKVSGRIWLDCNEHSFLGQGKVELLRKIQELGSLRQAAQAMGMSYRQAWENIKKINTCAPKPMVILKRGGINGGIAELTPFAIKTILDFEKLNETFEAFLISQSKLLNND